jgi:ribosomal protein L14E/L6E/L27E
LEVSKGLIVRANAGRDKNNFFIIINFDKKYAYICDGKSRPLERAKKKNLKHLFLTKTLLDTSLLQTNRALRKSLKKFNK